jgi:hypothetical protein
LRQVVVETAGSLRQEVEVEIAASLVEVCEQRGLVSREYEQGGLVSRLHAESLKQHDVGVVAASIVRVGPVLLIFLLIG